MVDHNKINIEEEKNWEKKLTLIKNLKSRKAYTKEAENFLGSISQKAKILEENIKKNWRRCRLKSPTRFQMKSIFRGNTK